MIFKMPKIVKMCRLVCLVLGFHIFTELGFVNSPLFVKGEHVWSDSYEEGIWIKSLPSGHISTHLEFVIKDDKSSSRNHTRLLPRALSEIFSAHDIQEMHFSLTQGHWQLESWGEPIIPAPTGALLSAWFFSDGKTQADANWKGFTSRLSGLTCASLNFLDDKTSIEPQFAYRPMAYIPENKEKKLFVRVGGLPREHICTENLTPWTKLLPCGISRGIASLLRSKQVFNTHYHSAGIHFTQTKTELQLKLTLSLVFDLPAFTGPGENFARKILGSLAIFPCHPSSKTTVQVWNKTKWQDVENNYINGLKIGQVPQSSKDDLELLFTPVKYMGGSGQEYGEMIVEMTNHLRDRDLNVLYVEVLPWYIRPYLHTMKIIAVQGKQLVNVSTGKLFHYTPGKDRQRHHKLEMSLPIPPSTTIRLSFLVEKGHLKWDEYPPDANHGFYLEAAHFEVNFTSPEANQNTIRHYFSRILLINLSTPDFSMPYNVICLTCTVVALAFGPIHNITTKRLQLKKINTEWMKETKNKIRKFFGRPVVDSDETGNEPKTNTSGNDATTDTNGVDNVDKKAD